MFLVIFLIRRRAGGGVHELGRPGVSQPGGWQLVAPRL
jgi:hypothetical protein